MTLAKFDHPSHFSMMIITFILLICTHLMSHGHSVLVAGSLTLWRLTEDVVGAGDAHAAVLLLGGSALYTLHSASSAQTPQPGP